jgi:hypothetical protein
MDAGMLITSIILRSGYVDVTAMAGAGDVAPGELVRLVFDVDDSAPVGAQTDLVCTAIDAVNTNDTVVLDARCSDGTLTILSWRE